MHLHVQQLLSHYGYFGIFAVLLLEMIGIPFPAETTLVLAGIEWTQGVFSLLPLLCVAAVGNILGSSIAYMIGRFLGHKVLLKFGRFVGITEERLRKAEQKFVKYGSPLLLVSKFIAGVRVLVPYLAGMNRMPFGLFTLLNTISALLWTSLFIVVGKYVGAFFHHFNHLLRPYLWPSLAVILVLAIVYGYIRTKKHKYEKTHSMQETR